MDLIYYMLSHLGVFLCPKNTFNKLLPRERSGLIERGLSLSLKGGVLERELNRAFAIFVFILEPDMC